MVGFNQLSVKSKSKFGHLVVQRSLHEAGTFHVLRHLGESLEPGLEGLQVGVGLEKVGDQGLVLVDQLVHHKINKGERVSGIPGLGGQKVGEPLQLAGQALQVGLLQVLKVRVVAESHPAVPEVHRLVRHHVHHGSLRVGLPEHVVLPGDVPEDGVALGDLDIPVDVVGQVGEVQTEAVLVVEPAGLVEARGRTAGELFVLEVCTGVGQEKSDGLGQAPDVPVTEDWRAAHLVRVEFGGVGAQIMKHWLAGLWLGWGALLTLRLYTLQSHSTDYRLETGETTTTTFIYQTTRSERYKQYSVHTSYNS